MANQIVARVRYGRKEHIRATKVKDVWWFFIRLGRSNMLTCDCGGAMKDKPKEMYSDSWGGCVHIVALYKGNITDDPRVFVSDYTVSKSPLWASREPLFGNLTGLGEKMFSWRWLVLKWKD